MTVYAAYRQTAGTLRGVPGVLVLANVLTATGAGLVNPLFARYLEALGATPQAVGWVLAVDYLLLCFGLVGGYVADRVGRKRSIVIAHWFFPPILLLFVLAQNWVWVLVGMFLLGIRVAAKPALDAVMADHTTAEERGRIYSLNWVAVTVATIVASCLLGAMTHRWGVYQGTRLGFVRYLVLAVIVAVLFWSRLKEGSRATAGPGGGAGGFLRRVAGVLRSSSPSLRLFVAYYLLQTPAAGMLAAYYVLYLVHVSGVSDGVAAVTYGVANGVYLVGQLLLGPLADRFNRVALLAWMTVAALLSVLTLVLFHRTAVLAILSSVGMLAVLSLTLYLHKVLFADLTRREDRATLFGVVSAIVAVEGALSLILGGRLFELNPHYPFLCSAVCVLAAGGVLVKNLKGGGCLAHGAVE
ncbi:MAG: MFS transporter [Desulfotomaculales bacterium]